MTTLIKVPFADSGDKSVIPATDAAGKVNWSQGFTPDYSKDPNTDPSAKRIEREDFNGLMNTLSVAIKEIQSSGVAPFITATDNGGSAFAYSKGALVFYNKAIWRSKVDANTVIPAEGANWSQLVAAESLGTASGRDIGNLAGNVPDMSLFTSGKSGTAGWMKFPNGFILQWGYIVTSSSTQVNVNFPIAFSESVAGGGAAYSITATAAANINATASGSTLSQISGLRTFNLSGAQAANGVFWTAMGF